MMQIVEQTYEEKMAMYMKQSKKKLAEMLIECNKHLIDTYNQRYTEGRSDAEEERFINDQMQ